ncbi:MAG: aldose 1-epimerase family protein [Candidatus Hydrogenedentes bacterium]|nr:aldose 1-epimerase family protein [Candidatus Hydrogenedentota bacterium]
MKINLTSGTLHITVADRGAELTSVKSVADNTEFIWQADPEIWGRHAPVLFPIVGKLKNDTYRLGGKEYKLGQHGFARDCRFAVVGQTDNSLTFELNESEETLDAFPFRFVLNVTYTLTGNRLEVGYAVNNPADTDLLFSIGGHPGFRCPIDDTESFSDYYIEFDHAETVGRRLVRDGLFRGLEPCYLNGQKTIELNAELFKEDALVFDNLRSDKLELRSRTGNHSITFEFPGFPYLGIWTKYGSDRFICIEPWYGLADTETFGGDFSQKEGIQRLGPDRTFRCKYGMTFV